MDYEKKYKEALERAKKYLNDEGYTEMADVFPELTESEDEKIRKWIVNLLHELHYNQTAQPMALKALAYLEKQAENPKSADSIPADCVSDAKCEDRSPKHTDSFGTDIRDTPAYWRGWDDAMKQKEQKPVDYDHEMWKNCEANFEGGKNEVIEHPEKYGLQKPAEWSEEDKKMVGEIRSIIAKYAFSESAVDVNGELCEEPYISMDTWLKSLRPQPKHRDTYYDIIHNILDMLKDMDFMKITPEHRVSLLNDIRVKCKNADECAAILDEPHWKPSEEQMEAFRSYIKDFQDRAEAAVGGWNNFDVMIRLFEQLKKLM